MSALPPKADTDWRCYNALHESRRDRRSNRQVTAGSTRPLPSLVHRIRAGPRRSRQGARLHRDQTWPPRWPRVGWIEKARDGIVSEKERRVMSLMGHERTFSDVSFSLNGVRFAPDSRHWRCTNQCLLGPKADIGQLFDHLVRARLHRRGHADAKRLGGFEIDDQFKLGCLHDWQFDRIFAF